MINNAVFYNVTKHGIAFIQNEGDFIFAIDAKKPNRSIKQLMHVLFQDTVRVANSAPTTVFRKKGHSLTFVHLKDDPTVMRNIARSFYRTTVAREKAQTLSALGEKILHKMNKSTSRHDLNAYFANKIAPSAALSLIDQAKKLGVYVFNKNIADAVDIDAIDLIGKVIYYSVDDQLFRKKLGISKEATVVHSNEKISLDMLKNKIISKMDAANVLVNAFVLSDSLTRNLYALQNLGLGKEGTELLFIQSLLPKGKTSTWYIREDFTHPGSIKGVFFNNGIMHSTIFEFNKHIKQTTAAFFKFLNDKKVDDHINNSENVAANNSPNSKKSAVDQLPEELKKIVLEEQQAPSDEKRDPAQLDKILKTWLLIVHPDKLVGKTKEDVQKLFEEKARVQISDSTAALILDGEISRICNEVRSEIDNKAK